MLAGVKNGAYYLTVLSSQVECWHFVRNVLMPLGGRNKMDDGSKKVLYLKVL